MLRAMLDIIIRDRHALAQDVAAAAAMSTFLVAASIWIVGAAP